MKKTITINLSGTLFQVEEDAYQILRQYLNELKQHFTSTENHEEILSDIEYRIAELLSEKLNGKKTFLHQQDIESIITIMGKASEMENENPANDNSDSKNAFPKKLFRNPDDKVIAGVCSGLSAYFGIADALWIRLAMILFLFIGFGAAFWLYIILWLIVPAAKNASDKLNMTGEKINIQNIEKKITNNIAQLKSDFKNGPKSNALKAVLSQLFSLCTSLLALVILILKKAFWLLLTLAGISILTVLFFSFTMPYLFLGAIFPNEIFVLLDNIEAIRLLILSLIFTLIIPPLFLIYAGLKNLLGSKHKMKKPATALFVLWVLSIILLLYSSFQIKNHFSEEIVLENHADYFFESDTLIIRTSQKDIDFLESKIPISFGNYQVYFSKNDTSFYLPVSNVNIEKSYSNQIEISNYLSAYGNHKNELNEKLKKSSLSFRQENKTLHIPAFIAIPKSDKFCFQKNSLDLKIPVGKIIFLESGMQHLINDIKNLQMLLDNDMINHYWLMTEKGLSCLDCESSNSSNASPYVSVFEIEPFHTIKIEDPLHLTFQNAADYGFEISGDDDFKKNISAKVENHILTISTHSSWKGKENIIVHTPVLPVLQMENGKSKIDFIDFSPNTLHIEASNNSHSIIKFSGQEIQLKASHNAKIKLLGEVGNFVAEGKGNVIITADEIKTLSSNIHLKENAFCAVRVDEKLKVTLSDNSRLNYSGTASILEIIKNDNAILMKTD